MPRVTDKNGLELKRCRECGGLKPLANFPRHSTSRDGYRGNCKKCNRARAARWKDANRQRKAATDRRWQERNPERVTAQVAQSRERHPAKQMARRAVVNARRRGELVKPTTCERCDRTVPPRDLHAHHHDYAEPLDVNWLCRACHHEVHRCPDLLRIDNDDERKGDEPT